MDNTQEHLESTRKSMPKRTAIPPIELRTYILLGLFIGCMVLVNTIGGKIITLAGQRVSVGILFVPILFLITDVVGEVHGKKRAQLFVYIAMGVLLLVLGSIGLAIILPPDSSWNLQSEYRLIFGSSLRITLASLIAFIISQFLDVHVFGLLKRTTKGKYLWIRNNVSTIVSQFIDTTIFMFIAFYNLTPKFTMEYVFSLIVPYFVFKIVFAIIDTPFCYLGVLWLRGAKSRGKGHDRSKYPHPSAPSHSVPHP